MSIIGSGHALLLASAAPAAAVTGVSRSLRFNGNADSAYLNRTPSSASNRTTWTWSGWAKRSNIAPPGYQSLFTATTAGNETLLYFDTSNRLRFYNYSGSTLADKVTTAVFRDPSAWYHIVLTWDTTNATAADRVHIYINGARETTFDVSTDAGSSEQSTINNTIAHMLGSYGAYANNFFDGYLADVNFVDGLALGPGYFAETDATTGQWVPKEFVTGGTTVNDGTQWSSFVDVSNATVGSGSAANLFDGDLTTKINISAGYIEIDLSSKNVQAGPEGIEVYNNEAGVYTSYQVNGGEVINWQGSAGWMSMGGANSKINTIKISYLSGGSVNAAFAFRVNGVTMLDSTTTTVGYGTNGFHLTFSDNSGTSSTTLGKDAAGSNNWTPNNFSVASGSGDDSLVDVPSQSGTDTGSGNEVRGNYCTWNPLNQGSNMVLKNGNLDIATTTGTSAVTGTIGVSSGKWYWETTINASSDRTAVGIAKAGMNLTDIPGDQDALGWSYYADGGTKRHNSTSTAYGAGFDSGGDVIGCAFDADNGTLTFYKNGVSQGTAFTGLTDGPYFPATGDGSGVNNANSSVNFGQRAWAYSAPSGYKALCLTNTTDPTITDPSAYMDAVLYTGNASTQAITGLGFGPDFVWTKSRSQAYHHRLYNIVSGAGKFLESSTTNSEATDASSIISFDANGFTLGSNDNGNYTNGGSAVAWCWDAGTFTASNTDGSITSSVRANASAGFSIVTYTGTGSAATVGHGLNDAPQMIIVKSRNNVTDWCVYHANVGNTAFLKLNTTSASQSFNAWNSTSPTSSVFSIGNIGETNTNTYTYVAYCFAPVAGFSAFGSYTGSSDLPFVWTGFKSRFILIKSTSIVGQWGIWDTARNSFNVTNSRIIANLSNAELTHPAVAIDVLSNGFKLRNTDSDSNQSSASYIWAAFAESPFKFANAR